jgi:hypothetical protein
MIRKSAPPTKSSSKSDRENWAITLGVSGFRRARAPIPVFQFLIEGKAHDHEAVIVGEPLLVIGKSQTPTKASRRCMNRR